MGSGIAADWQKAGSDMAFDWQDALKFVNDRVQASHSPGGHLAVITYSQN